MSTTIDISRGAVLKSKDFSWEQRGKVRIAHPVGPHNGAKTVTGIVLDIPAGESFTSNEKGTGAEIIGVVFRGKGTVRVGDTEQQAEHASAFHAPSGLPYTVTADAGESITVYVWQSPRPEGVKTASDPRRFNHLYNEETVFVAYKGNNTDQANVNPANMNFLFWPGTGSAHLSLHCGIQQPGQSFSVHNHPISEELFIGVEGKGEVHLNGEWFEFEAGDILYSPEVIYHGTRNPHTGPEAKRFVTCGGPTPFDVNFYVLAGVSPEVID